MHSICDGVTMAKKKSTKTAQPAERATLVNLKGTEEGRIYFQQLSRITGVSISEIVRRGVVMWATKRGVITPSPPADWARE